MTDLNEQLQKPLYDFASEGLERSVTELGRFTPFAVAMLPNGEFAVIETSGESSDPGSVQQALTSDLRNLRESHGIVASLMCLPIEVPSAGLQAGAVMEIEAAGCAPVRVLRQIKHSSGTPTLASEMKTMPGDALVFDAVQ